MIDMEQSKYSILEMKGDQNMAMDHNKGSEGDNMAMDHNEGSEGDMKEDHH